MLLFSDLFKLKFAFEIIICDFCLMFSIYCEILEIFESVLLTFV